MKRLTVAIFPALFGLMLAAETNASEFSAEAGAAKEFQNTLQKAALGTDPSPVAADIPKSIEARVLALFPEPFAGWRAGPPRAREDLATKVLVANSYGRRYLREDGAQITLGVVIDAPIFPFLALAVHGPLASGKHDGLKPYTLYSLDEWTGTLDRQGTDSYTISLVIGDRILVQGHSTGTPDPCALDEYIRALDVDAILAILPER